MSAAIPTKAWIVDLMNEVEVWPHEDIKKYEQPCNNKQAENAVIITEDGRRRNVIVLKSNTGRLYLVQPETLEAWEI